MTGCLHTRVFLVCCETCLHVSSTFRATIYPDKTLESYRFDQSRWFSTLFCNCFCVLLAHSLHCATVQYVNSSDGSLDVPEEDRYELRREVEEVVSLCLEKEHFAVIHLIRAQKIITIYDGFGKNARYWIRDILRLLKRCKLIEKNGPTTTLE